MLGDFRVIKKQIKMSVSVNMVNCVDILFEQSENLPGDFYLDIMNLIRNYYEYGNNLEEIHKFLVLNENRIDKKLFQELKSIFTFEQKIVNQVVVKQGCDFYDKLYKCCFVTCSVFLVSIPLGFMACFIVISIIHKT